MNIVNPIKSSDYEKQITDALYRNAGAAITGSVLNIALVSFVLANAFPSISLLIWFISGQVLNFVRWCLLKAYQNNPALFPVHKWLSLHRVLTLVSGSLYGVLAVVFFDSYNPIYQVLVILLVGGMGAAAVGTHGVDKFTYRAFILSAVIPLIGRCIYEDTEVHITMAFMLCLLIAIMIKAANQTQQIMLENIQMSESLKYRATHDGLVGLLNREEFVRAFNEQALIHNDSGELFTSLIFIDLDNFKALNDSLGHLAGDKALIEISEIIRQSIRNTDIAARFGGDEFMILIKSETLEQAKSVANKVLKRIDEYQSQLEYQRESNLGASIGIGYTKLNNTPFAKLLQTADRACYSAKNSGKGKICSEEVALESS